MIKKIIIIIFLYSQVSFSEVIKFTAKRSDDNSYFYSGLIKKDKSVSSTIYCKKYSLIQKDYFSFNESKEFNYLKSENFQNNVILNVKRQKDTVFVSKKTLHDLEKKEIVFTEDIVLNKTLNFKIIDNWDVFLKLGEIEFDLLVPSQMDTYSFVLDSVKVDSKNIYFDMYPSSYFLRLIISDMKFVYDLSSKKIVRYSGPAQIPVDGEKNVDVIVDFDYLSSGFDFSCSGLSK